MVKKPSPGVIAAALCLLLCAAYLLFTAHGGVYAEITVDGKTLHRIPLDASVTEIKVDGVGGHNLVRIGDGRAAVISADCPDKVCVDMGELTREGQAAVCLPHRVVLKVVR